MSFFGLNFGGNADVDIILDGQDERRMAEIKDENGRKERHYLYYDGESVTGKVNVTLHRKTNRLEHQGIKIEFLGQIELYYDRGNHHEFLSLVKQLAGPGDLVQNTSFDFEFNQVEKPYECYTGANVRLRYFLRVTIVRRLTDMTKEMDLLVHTLATYPEMNNPIKMEVGIEECLHIEFEYNKSKYHLKDVIVGKIYFLLVRIKIKHMEVAIIKRETTGSGPNTFHDNETIAKYEIMDGAPVKGESIPIRVFLAGYDLTPTMRDINKKFSVKYYLNLVLVDEEERRYFKQQEITLWRKGERVARKGPPQGVYGHHQIPHAMARHEAGEYPSANVRTAPTPSEPNTPVMAAAAATNAVGDSMPAPQQYHQQHHEHPAAFHSVPVAAPIAAQVNDVAPDQPAQQQQIPAAAPPAAAAPAPTLPAESASAAPVPEPLPATTTSEEAEEAPPAQSATPPPEAPTETAVAAPEEDTSKPDTVEIMERAPTPPSDSPEKKKPEVEEATSRLEGEASEAAPASTAAVLSPEGERPPPMMDDLTLEDEEDADGGGADSSAAHLDLEEDEAVEAAASSSPPPPSSSKQREKEPVPS